ncbi:response regulator [Nibrella saemangeumensis]|uniref:Response regulator n=1 Tax=Nibrella saemangeumensis TaxID=1084526 RepID=A0ABP8NSL3_9BACT
MHLYNGAQTLVRSRVAPKVLVVEDNPDHWVFMQKAMQENFTEVEPVVTTSAAQTLDYLTTCSNRAEVPPKLILMDLYLPDRKDGWQLLNQIKKLDPPFDRIPVVVLSHSNNPQDIAESYRQGINSYLVKPTQYQEWLHCFQVIKEYWWETVTLPDFPFYQ